MDQSRPGLGTCINRRALLQTVGIGLTSPVLAQSVAGRTQVGEEESAASITFNDQTSTGKRVKVERVETDVPARLVIRDESRNKVISEFPKRFEPGESMEKLVLGVGGPLIETTELSACLYHTETDQRVAVAYATVTIAGDTDSPGIGPTLIEADPDAGFNYPYYLYAPDELADGVAAPIMVEPTNSGESTNDFDVQKRAAAGIAHSGIGRKIADGLPAPFVVPVFPRPRSQPVDYTHYVHALDNTTMGISSGPLERVDLQLLAMVEDARDRLSAEGLTVSAGIMLNGFSASGNFVERFAALHPDEVVSVTAGGLNGMPILPIEEAKGHTLDYHIGVANLEELTGDAFDLEAFREVDQFLYMGDRDSNDTIPYNDAWTNDFDELALDVYGADMLEERFPYSRAVYESVNAQAVFRIFEGLGHGPPANDDLIEFHKQSLAGAEFETLQAEFGGNVPNLNAHIEFTPEQPTAGEQVAFDASESMIGDSEIVSYEWEFNGEVTKRGELVTYTFETRGGHTVRLTVTDAEGNTYESTTLIEVEQTAGSESPDTTNENNAGGGLTSVELPGFGLGTGLLALTGGASLWARRARTDPPEQ